MIQIWTTKHERQLFCTRAGNDHASYHLFFVSSGRSNTLLANFPGAVIPFLGVTPNGYYQKCYAIDKEFASTYIQIIYDFILQNFTEEEICSDMISTFSELKCDCSEQYGYTCERCRTIRRFQKRLTPRRLFIMVRERITNFVNRFETARQLLISSYIGHSLLGGTRSNHSFQKSILARALFTIVTKMLACVPVFRFEGFICTKDLPITFVEFVRAKESLKKPVEEFEYDLPSEYEWEYMAQKQIKNV